MKTLWVIAYICASCFNLVAGTTILPTDPNIQYLGRFDNSNPLSPKISWTGAQILANFHGTLLKIIMNSSSNTYYNVTVDGVLTVLPLNNGNITYPVVTGLSDTIHTVVLFKRDSPWNPQNFNGFVLDQGKQLAAPPERKIRKIEFYGDSQTQGAQTDVAGPGPDLGPVIYDNNFNSYDALTARALGAEYTCIAQNGASLTPYATRQNIPAFYNRTGLADSYSIWDFSKWQADVVCINLGVNDSPFPTDFTSRYVSFVQKLRKNYPNAHIFLLSGPLWNDTALKDAIAATVTSLNTQGDSKVYYYAFKQSVNHDGHPRTSEHLACAKELVAEINKVIWSGSAENVQVDDVLVTPASVSLVKKTTKQLTSTVFPFDASNQAVTWSSSNIKVATVSASGLVTAIASGTRIGVPTAAITDTLTWKQTVLTFTLPANAATATIHVYFEAHGITANFVLTDDWALVAGTTPLPFLPTAIKTAQPRKLKLYPNPLKDQLLTIEGITAGKSISLFDMSGRLVFTRKFENSEKLIVDFRNLVSKGTYLVRIDGQEYKFSQLLRIQ